MTVLHVCDGFISYHWLEKTESLKATRSFLYDSLMILVLYLCGSLELWNCMYFGIFSCFSACLAIKHACCLSIFSGEIQKLHKKCPPETRRQNQSDHKSWFSICAMVKVVAILGMGKIPPLMTGILISWVYKPLLLG